MQYCDFPTRDSSTLEGGREVDFIECTDVKSSRARRLTWITCLRVLASYLSMARFRVHCYYMLSLKKKHAQSAYKRNI